MGFHENPCSGWQSQEAKRNMGGTTRYSRAWENISQPNKTRFKCEKQAITQIDVSYPGASQFEVARIRSKKRIQLQVPPRGRHKVFRSRSPFKPQQIFNSAAQVKN